MTEFRIACKRYRSSGDDIESLIIHNWTDEQMKNMRGDDLENRYPPFAQFFVNGDPERERLAQKFAFALRDALNEHQQQVNSISVTIKLGK